MFFQSYHQIHEKCAAASSVLPTKSTLVSETYCTAAASDRLSRPRVSKEERLPGSEVEKATQCCKSEACSTKAKKQKNVLRNWKKRKPEKA